MKRVSLPTKIVALVLSANLSNVNAQSSGELHVPSPDWREQIIYFVMVDRFARSGAVDPGDPDSDPERTNWSQFWGGNLQGLIHRLDHLERLGVRTLVCSPIFEQCGGTDEGDRGRVAP